METPSPTLPEILVFTDLDASIAFRRVQGAARRNDLTLGPEVRDAILKVRNPSKDEPIQQYQQ